MSVFGHETQVSEAALGYSKGVWGLRGYMSAGGLGQAAADLLLRNDCMCCGRLAAAAEDWPGPRCARTAPSAHSGLADRRRC